MNAVVQPKAPDASDGGAGALLARQREAFLAELPVPRAVRRDRLDRAIALLVDHQDDFCEALAADYGQRPALLSKFVDLVSAVNALRHARSRLPSWMRPRRRPVRFPLNLLGAGARVEYQPLGVVGIVSPWNFPVNLSFGPLAGALAAGNRALIKPSEYTPETSELMRSLVAERFDETELAVITGGAEVAGAFTALPFDHLLFTGSTTVGRHVMRAAAEHLTPVTLELGGKSPVILGRDADLETACDRIVVGKMMNAGQVCLAPDYLLVPEERVDALVAALRSAVQGLYPSAGGNPDYTNVIDARNAERLEGLLEEARSAGARVEALHPGPGPDAPGDRRLPLTVVIGAPDSLALMREEIFGPILPIVGYADIDAAIAYVNQRPRPLALYYFGPDAQERRRVLDRTVSGGVTVDDVVFHFSVEELPFGGVGASGMGAYHGRAGFLTFSHERAVYRQSRFDIARLIGAVPPYGKRLAAMIRMDLRR